MKPRIALCVGLMAVLCARQAAAQHVSLDIRDGNVTLDARNATLQRILEEWSHVGGVTVVNGEKLATQPVTILLRDLSEREALEVLLRDLSGYVLSAKKESSPGTSEFAQILLVPSSSAPDVRPSTAVTRSQALPTTFALPDLSPSTARAEDGESRRGSAGSALAFGDGAAAVDAVDANPGTRDAVERGSRAARPSAEAEMPPVDPSLRPLTPMRPASPEADPTNPFGNVAGSARPGTIAPSGPPPGVAYPPVTNPDLERSRSGVVTLH